VTRRRDQVWLGVGFLAGACLVRLLERLRRPVIATVSEISVSVPKRVFKLATAQELGEFEGQGCISSALDKSDGFVHLSDRSSPPKVAALFFSRCADLHLIELDATKLVGPVQWIVGASGDAAPSSTALCNATTTVHYLIADGCVHVYGGVVSMDAIVRVEKVPLGPQGHVFPDWL